MKLEKGQLTTTKVSISGNCAILVSQILSVELTHDVGVVADVLGSEELLGEVQQLLEFEEIRVHDDDAEELVVAA